MPVKPRGRNVLIPPLPFHYLMFVLRDRALASLWLGLASSPAKKNKEQKRRENQKERESIQAVELLHENRGVI